MFPCPLVFHPRLSQVNLKGNKPNKRKGFHRNRLGLNHSFKVGNSNRSGMKSRQFRHPKKKFNGCGDRLTPLFAPHNTTSFITRAKKSSGVAMMVSTVTPAILPTPMLSPTNSVVEMDMKQRGINCFDSMKGPIQLQLEKYDSDNDSNKISSANNKNVMVEKWLDNDLSRFEMKYPTYGKEQNLTLRWRIFLRERELGDLRRRVRCLETDRMAYGGGGSDNRGKDVHARDVCSKKSGKYGVIGGGDNGDNGHHNYV
ncbi:PRLI-interacting factor A [Spatholobus suberectus]|nr:PRLI-interacting factor A [Spatholobus suberectus]